MIDVAEGIKHLKHAVMFLYVPPIHEPRKVSTVLPAGHNIGIGQQLTQYSVTVVRGVRIMILPTAAVMDGEIGLLKPVMNMITPAESGGAITGGAVVMRIDIR